MGNGQLTMRQRDAVTVASDPSVVTQAEVGRRLGVTRQRAHVLLTTGDAAELARKGRDAKLDKARSKLARWDSLLDRLQGKLETLSRTEENLPTLAALVDLVSKARKYQLEHEQHVDPDQRRTAEMQLGEQRRLDDLSRWGNVVASVGAPAAERLARIANRLLKRSESRLGESRMLEKERSSANVR